MMDLFLGTHQSFSLSNLQAFLWLIIYRWLAFVCFLNHYCAVVEAKQAKQIIKCVLYETVL